MTSPEKLMERLASILDISNPCSTCGKPVGHLKDALSYKEFRISGMCQECQDKTFRNPEATGPDGDQREQAELDALAGAAQVQAEEEARDRAQYEEDRHRDEEDRGGPGPEDPGPP